MAGETALGELRRRVGVVDAVARLAWAGEAGDGVRPAVNGMLAFPGEAHLLGPTAALCGFAPFHFSRVFKHVLGVGFHEFADRVRVDRTLIALAAGDADVDEVARAHGFLGTATMGLSIEEHTGLPLLAVVALLGA